MRVYIFQQGRYGSHGIVLQNLNISRMISKCNSPMAQKKTHLEPITPHKKNMPSRYIEDKAEQKFTQSDVLNTIEVNMKTADLERSRIIPKSPQHKRCQKLPPLQKKTQVLQQFKPKPIRREDSDIQNFKQIFLKPKETLLTDLKAKIKSSSKEKQNKYLDKNLKSSTNDQINEELKETQLKNCFQECIQILSNEYPQSTSSHVSEIYQEMIKVQPPENQSGLINSNVKSCLNYAPSIPLTLDNTSSRKKLTELLIRAKAGLNSDDAQKEAHLAYYLGIIYQNKGKHMFALKFYRRYLSYAKILEDKIGMTLGYNRIGICYYMLGKTEKSISFHNQNLKLSDSQNCFSGFYNLGICYRKMHQFEQALQYFNTAFQWSLQRAEVESEYLTLGQLGVTYCIGGNYQLAVDNFQKSLKICSRLGKHKIQEANILNIILISSEHGFKSDTELQQLGFAALQVDIFNQASQNPGLKAELGNLFLHFGHHPGKILLSLQTEGSIKFIRKRYIGS